MEAQGASIEAEESEGEKRRVTILVEDAKLMIQVIDRAAETGALKGPELLPVGVLRHRLQSVLS